MLIVALCVVAARWDAVLRNGIAMCRTYGVETHAEGEAPMGQALIIGVEPAKAHVLVSWCCCETLH